MSLLAATGLTKSYPSRRNFFGRVVERRTVVDDVSISIEAGQTLAVVGESGAGKSTVARMVNRLVEPDSGSVTIEGIDVLRLPREDLRRLRARVQMVFQDPYSSFNPRKPLVESVGEPLLVHTSMSRSDRHRVVGDLFERVGLSGNFLSRFPRELSGGQLQRAAIARALAPKPSLIICDEPVAALDVSVRAQVLNLMRGLQEEDGLAYLFITHDLSLVEVIGDAIVVMRAGKVVERGDVRSVFASPQDAYTQELLSAIPVPIPRALRDPERRHCATQQEPERRDVVTTL